MILMNIRREFLLSLYQNEVVKLTQVIITAQPEDSRPSAEVFSMIRTANSFLEAQQ